MLKRHDADEIEAFMSRPSDLINHEMNQDLHHNSLALNPLLLLILFIAVMPQLQSTASFSNMSGKGNDRGKTLMT